MRKIAEKIKAWFKAIDWKKVRAVLLGIIGAGLVYALVETISEKFGNYRLNSDDYRMDIYNEAARIHNESGKIEEINAKWEGVDLKNDREAFEKYESEHRKVFKEIIDEVAKAKAINGKMVDFDEREPITLRPVGNEAYTYTAEFHATIKNVD